MTAPEDDELLDWLYGVVNNSPVEAGGFLHAIAEAATRADYQNYPLLRPVLLHLRAKYPNYSYAAGHVTR